jgi:hypothetical protein
MSFGSKSWLALSGPIALGAVLGLGSGSRAIFAQSLLLPCLVVGLTLALAPALYIGLSLAGGAPPALAVLGELRKGLMSTGIVMAGLSPAVAFLVVSSGARTGSVLLGIAVAGGAALIGLRQLFRGLLDKTPSKERFALIFVPWAMIALALGTDLLVSLLESMGRGT